MLLVANLCKFENTSRTLDGQLTDQVRTSHQRFFFFLFCVLLCNEGRPTSACLRHTSRFLRCALEKWSQAFCLLATEKTFSICSTLTGRQALNYRRDYSQVKKPQSSSTAPDAVQRSILLGILTVFFLLRLS